jgi:DNA invertase Pin-like site-specific DNA recombinase
MKKLFVSYRRVSTAKQGASGLGLEAQQDIISYFVEHEQGEVVTDYCEVHSGKNLDECPELHRAMNEAKKLNATLIIAKTDRFRNVAQALEVLDVMGEKNVMFCDLPHTDRFTLTLFFALAERERLITSIRTKQALKAKKEQGFKLGRPDAEFTAEQVAKSVEVRKRKAAENGNNKRAWATVQHMIDKPLKEIADYLNANGFTTSQGGQWRSNQVSRLIKAMKGGAPC